MRDMLQTAFFMAIIYQTPLFLIEYLFYYPNRIDHVVEIFLLYPSPVMMLPYYYLMRKIMKLSPEQVLDSLDDMVCLQHITLLLFSMYCSLWSRTYTEYTYRYLLSVDLFAMGTTLFTIFGAILIAFCSKRFRHGLKSTAVSMPLLHFRAKLGWVFMSVLSNYALLILFSALLLDKRQALLGVIDAFLYLVLILIFIFRVLDNFRRRRLHHLKWNERITNEYVSALTGINNEMRSIRHDWNNILQVYDGYISAEDMAGLRSYHGSVVNTAIKTQKNYELISALSHRRAIYTTLQAEVKKAQQHRVQLDIDQIDIIADVLMHDLDICRILSNLLDNAIEAASETSEKKLYIKGIVKNENKISLEIKNSAEGSIDLQSIFKQGWTSKPNHNGLGLDTVRKILSNYDECCMLVDYRQGIFTTCLVLTTA